MRWVVIGVVVLVVLYLVVVLFGTARRPRPQRSVGRAMRVDPTPSEDPDDRSRDE